jgi:hypothetical protein
MVLLFTNDLRIGAWVRLHLLLNRLAWATEKANMRPLRADRSPATPDIVTRYEDLMDLQARLSKVDVGIPRDDISYFIPVAVRFSAF